MQKVCVQGLGFVGSAMATAVASARKNQKPIYRVVGVDIDKRKITAINEGELLFFCEDDSLKKKLKEAVLEIKNLKASNNPDEYKDADIVIVDVDLSVDKKSPYEEPKVTIKRFEIAIKTFAQKIKPDCLVIIETTVPPGTTKNIVEKTVKQEFFKRNISSKPLICHSYERVMPGKHYLKSITHFWRNYSANCQEAKDRAQEFFENIIDTKNYPLTYFNNSQSTELAKVLENSYRAMNIAFIQEWTELAEDMGINLFEVIQAIKKRKGTHDNIMNPGFGVGGYCLPKDALFAQWGANHFYSGKKLPLTLQAIAINDKMPLHTLNRIKQHIDLTDKKVLILGYSYMPDVADTRNSPSKILCDALKKEGATCLVTDPIIETYHDKIDVFCGQNYQDFDILVLAVRHKEYLELDPNKFSQSLKPQSLIVDTFNILDDAKITVLKERGHKVIGIGKGHLNE